MLPVFYSLIVRFSTYLSACVTYHLMLQGPPNTRNAFTKLYDDHSILLLSSPWIEPIILFDTVHTDKYGERCDKQPIMQFIYLSF